MRNVSFGFPILAIYLEQPARLARAKPLWKRPALATCLALFSIFVSSRATPIPSLSLTGEADARLRVAGEGPNSPFPHSAHPPPALCSPARPEKKNLNQTPTD